MHYRKLQEFIGSRAVFYARVSTAEEEQLNAIELQIEENRNVISSNKWILADEYIDRSKTGTVIKGRDEYQRLFEDMLTDKFDIIVIKDQERLMRNTRDWYLFVDRLVQTGKQLFLYLDGKFFYPGEDALITGIKAIMAEEYSRNLSKKLHNFNDRRMEKLKAGDLSVTLQGSGNAYGWDKKGGKYTINPEQFKVRRFMCELLMQGKGSAEIAKTLNDAGFRNSVGNPWKSVDIPKFVYDEKNIGVLTLNKERKDFEGKRRIKNPPEEWVRVENALPPVVTMEEWEKILKIRDQRLTQVNGHNRGKKVSSYFSGKIICGHCGASYWRKQRAKSDNEYWVCSTKQTYGRMTRKKESALGKVGEHNPKGCDNDNVSTDYLMEILELVSACLEANTAIIKDDMIKYLTEIKKSILRANTGFTEEDLKREETRKDRLLDSYLDGIISKEDYQRKVKSIEERLRGIKSDLDASRDNLEDIKDIDRIIENIDKELEMYLTGGSDLRLKWLMDNLDGIVVYDGAVVLKLPVIGKGVIAGKFQYVSRSKRCR